MTVILDSTMAPGNHLPITASIEQLQTDEQRLVLDTVAQIRKCGLDGVLSLPQLVVCGDQSAGKSSVLEAVTEIPFPRNDNLCTRFATEITLRRGPSDLLIVRVIPDPTRPSAEQASIKAFSETISNFDDLPRVMALAMTVMGLDSAPSTSSPVRAFARDVLSVEIEGPSRPQLTLVDVPGLIQTETKGVTREDREMVAEITEFYIKQPRTICLAVVSAMNDYANQAILTKVRAVDPTGERTLGIITKPDKLDAGSGGEAAFLALARNEDIFFKLGWHVVKNRKFEEAAFTFDERNASEATFFRTSNFKALPTDSVGIDALRLRLSLLLFEHVKRELPDLHRDLETAITETTLQLDLLGASRATPQECRTYLTQLSMTCLGISKAAIDGHYEAEYFQVSRDDHFSPDSPASIRRFRAVVQHLNGDFAESIRTNGPKYSISSQVEKSVLLTLPKSLSDSKPIPAASSKSLPSIEPPIPLSQREAITWVEQVLVRSRGKEPIGNYNPLIIGELFWELSYKWSEMAKRHVERVFQVSKVFFDTLLQEKCPKDVHARLSALKVTEALRKRRQNALDELGKLTQDNGEFPVTYNHYYTDTIQKMQTDRIRDVLNQAVSQATTQTPIPACMSNHVTTKVDTTAVVTQIYSKVNQNMVYYSCERLLDCVLSMYKVSNMSGEA